MQLKHATIIDEKSIFDEASGSRIADLITFLSEKLVANPNGTIEIVRGYDNYPDLVIRNVRVETDSELWLRQKIHDTKEHMP